MLAWLSIWSKVQMICTWSSWCHCHPIVSCFVKIPIGLTFLVLGYPAYPGKEAVKQVSWILSHLFLKLMFSMWLRHACSMSGNVGSVSDKTLHVVQTFLFLMRMTFTFASCRCELQTIAMLVTYSCLDRCHTCNKVARLWLATRGRASKLQVWQGMSHVASWRVALSRDSFSE